MTAEPRAARPAMPARHARGLGMFMGVMTIVWLTQGFARNPPAAVVGAILGGAIVVGAVTLGRGRTAPATADAASTGNAAPGGKRANRVFVVAVLLEVVAALAAVVTLSRTGHPEYVLPVIGLVVALHFFVFLISQRSALHVAAGVVGTGGAVVAIVVMASGAAGPDVGHAIVGIALGACTLAYGVAFLRRIAAPRDGASSRRA